MKKLFWFVAGISLGVVASKQLKENPKAQELAADVTRRAKDFGAAVSDGFREREAELAKASAPKKAPVKRAPAKAKPKTAAKK